MIPIPGPTEYLLTSFTSLVSNISALEQRPAVDQLEAQLNALNVLPPANMRAWIRAWDAVKKYIGQVSQMYGYFQGYVRGAPGSAVAPESLSDFAASVVTQNQRPKDGSLEAMLAEFHASVVAVPAAGDAKANTSDSLFRFLMKRLEEVRVSSIYQNNFGFGGRYRRYLSAYLAVNPIERAGCHSGKKFTGEVINVERKFIIVLKCYR